MKKIGKILSLCLTLCILATVVAGFGISSVSATDETLPKYTNYNGNLIRTTGSAPQSIAATLDTTVFEQGGYSRNGDGNTVGDTWIGVTNDQWVKPFSDTDTWIWDGYAYRNIANNVLGTKFTAPYTGKITVSYQLGNGGNKLENGVASASAWGGGAHTKAELVVGKGDMVLSSSDGSVTNAISRTRIEELTTEDFLTQKSMELDVKAGESVYFLIHNQMGTKHLAYFYINGVEYTEVKLSTQTAKVIGHNVATLENPVLRFYVQVSADATGNAAEIRIGNDDAITVSGISAAGITGPNGNELTEEDHVLIYSIPVPAKRMTETITISIKNDEGNELLTEKNTYSVSEYCTALVKEYKDAKAAGTNTDDQLAVAKICTQILAYGKSAQQFFRYNLDHLPVIDEEVYALVVADVKN